MNADASDLVDIFGNKLISGKKARLADYSPWDIGSWFRTPRDLPLFNFHTIRAMQFDEMVRLGMSMREGVIANAQLGYQTQDGKWVPGVKSEDKRVSEFIWSTWKRVWTYEIDKWLKCMTWGWAGGETVWFYNKKKKRVEFDYAISPHPRDVRTVRHPDHGLVAVEIMMARQENGEPLRLGIDAKGFFVANREESGSDYGVSDYLGAYSAFADKWFEGGALDVRRLFMHSDAYRGMRIGFPTGSTTLDGIGLVPNQNIARQMVEQYKSGNVMTYPLVYDASGKEKWRIDDAQSSGNVQHILQYPQDLDTSILRGLEIPDDVLTSQMSGAWQGKKVPMIAFFVSLGRQANKILRSVDTSVIAPAVRWEFGSGVDYELGLIPFDVQLEISSQANNPQGGPGGMAPGGMAPGGMPQGAPGGMPAGLEGLFGGGQGGGEPMFGEEDQSASMSLERAVGRGIISAASVAAAGRRLLNEALIQRGWVPFLDEDVIESEPRVERLSLKSDVIAAAKKTDRNPSEEDAESGDYKKGKVKLHGLTFVIENPKGSIRRGDGWQVKMPCHYGYIDEFAGADGDKIDAFVGPVPESELVVVIDQVKEDGETFDEHKVMLGFLSEDEAVKGYQSAYSRGWKVGPVTTLTMQQFKRWLELGWQSHRVSDFNLGALQMSCEKPVEMAVEEVSDFDQLRQKLDADCESSDARIRDIASVLRLVMVTGVRPGERNVDAADGDGLLNLASSCVIQQSDSGGIGPGVRFSVLGQDGVDYQIDLEDPLVQSDLVERCARGEGRLFSVTLADLKQYLLGFMGGALQLSDLRRRVATKLASQYLQEQQGHRSPMKIKALIAAREVGKRLGCSSKVVLQSLVDPSVFEA